MSRIVFVLLLLAGVEALAQFVGFPPRGWVEEAVARKAVAANELEQGHIDSLVSKMVSTIGYKTTNLPYGPSLYRVNLKYDATTQSGSYFLGLREYLVFLQTSGQSTVFSDDTWVIKEVNKVTPQGPLARRKAILDYVRLDPSFYTSRAQAQAQAVAEKYVITHANGPTRMSSLSTAVIGAGVATNGRSVFYRFEINSETQVTQNTPPQARRTYLIAIQSSATREGFEIFAEDPRLN